MTLSAQQVFFLHSMAGTEASRKKQENYHEHCLVELDHVRCSAKPFYPSLPVEPVDCSAEYRMPCQELMKSS